MRRLLQLHPQVSRIYHELFLLKICQNKPALLKYVSNKGVNPKQDNWGEKVPYYPSARKYPIIKYCQQWEKYFGKSSRILHIVRHPCDVALSNVAKFKNINNVGQPIKTYKGIVPRAIEEIDKLKTSFTFKYEDLLTNQDEMMYKIYQHCGVTPDFDFKEKMKLIKNKRYQSIDPSRAFAYREQNLKWKYDLNSVIESLNKVEGIKYDL